MKVGFYDSGLGGAKTLKDIIDMGLNEEVYFLADLKNNPYGTKKAEDIKKIALENVTYLHELGCKIIVVACNTATSVAIEDLRNRFPDIEIIGIEPAIKIAIDEHLHKNILVLATTITVQGEKLQKLITKLNDDNVNIELVKADHLVTLIEDENFMDNEEEVNNYLMEILNNYDLSKFSHIVLGCTHFSLIKSNLEKMVKDIKVIDGNNGIGKNLLQKIESSNDQSHNLKIHVLVTKESKVFSKRIKEVLGDVEVKEVNYDNY